MAGTTRRRRMNGSWGWDIWFLQRYNRFFIAEPVVVVMTRRRDVLNVNGKTALRQQTKRRPSLREGPALHEDL